MPRRLFEFWSQSVIFAHDKINVRSNKKWSNLAILSRISMLLFLIIFKIKRGIRFFYKFYHKTLIWRFVSCFAPNNAHIWPSSFWGCKKIAQAQNTDFNCRFVKSVQSNAIKIEKRKENLNRKFGKFWVKCDIFKCDKFM